MNTIGLFVTCLYFGLSATQSFRFRGKLLFNKTWLLSLSLVILILHGYLLYRWIDTQQGQNLTSFNLFSLMVWLIACMVVISAITKQTESLLIFILPICGLSILWVLYIPQAPMLMVTKAHPIYLWHILVSILAFSTLGFAALQALIVKLQSHLLKLHRHQSLLKCLPPIQAMEHFLIQLLWMGFVLLSLALIITFIWMNNLNVLNVQMKTFFSVFSWILFAILLYRHHCLSLSNRQLTTGTILAASLLILSYFGTKTLLG